jgi:hypothetical protein
MPIRKYLARIDGVGAPDSLRAPPRRSPLSPLLGSASPVPGLVGSVGLVPSRPGWGVWGVEGIGRRERGREGVRVTRRRPGALG